MKTKTLTILTISFFLFSCSNEFKRSSTPQNWADSVTHHNYISITNQLGLHPNKKTIRVWEQGPFDRYRMAQLIIEPEAVSKCTYTIFDQWLDERGSWRSKPLLDSVIVKCQQIESINLYNELIQAGFDTIKSQGDYPKFENIVADGIGYSIQLIDGDYNKFIHFHCPGAYEDNTNQKYIDFLNIVEKYIDLYRPLKCGK